MLLSKVKTITQKSVFIIILIVIFLLISKGVKQHYGLNNTTSKKAEMLDGIMTYEEPNGFLEKMIINTAKPLIESRIDYHLRQLGVMTHIKKNIFEDANITMQDIKIGSGIPITCGQVIDLEWQRVGSPEIPNSISLKVGFGTIERAIQLGILGMRKGGSRIITVKTDEGEFKEFYVTIKGIKTELPRSVHNIRIFNNIIGVRKAATCADTVSINYTIYDIYGSLLYENKDNVTFKIGEGKVPLGLELGLLNSQRGTKRTIIIPPDLLQVNDNMIDSVKDLKNHKGHELLLIDIEHNNNI